MLRACGLRHVRALIMILGCVVLLALLLLLAAQAMEDEDCVVVMLVNTEREDGVAKRIESATTGTRAPGGIGILLTS
jgi:hypothetical protein